MRALVVASILLIGIETANAAKMTFTSGYAGNCCNWIAGEGEITASTPSDFQAFVKRYPNESGDRGRIPSIIYLASPGGSLTAAMELGRMFRALHLTTVVGLSRHFPNSSESEPEAGDCFSACVFAYAGGLFRYYQDAGIDGNHRRAIGSRLGIHQASFESDNELTTSPAAREVAATLGVQAGQFITAIEIAYMVDMGIDPAIIGVASSTSAHDIRVLTEDEAKIFRLALPVDQKPQWALKPFRQGIVLTGNGAYSQQNYQLSLWCAEERTGQMVLSMTVGMVPQDPDPQRRANDAAGYHYALELEGGQSDIRVPVARVVAGVKQVTVTLALPPGAVQALAAGAAVRVHSDAPRVDDFWPYAYFSVPPAYFTLLRKACAG